MTKTKLLLGLIIICALTGCEKHNILDTRTTYCKVLINGKEYKDAPTLREQLGKNGYPYSSTKERIFIRKEKLAQGVEKFHLPMLCPTIYGDRCPSWCRVR